MAEESELRSQITKVWAKNFRSIESAELELDPLTVLVGPNASGKSNLLDILGIISDAARFGLETSIIRRGGIDSIGHRSPTGRILGPEVGCRYEFEGGTLDYAFALTRVRKGEYRIRREYAKLDPTDSDDFLLECEISSNRLTKPNLTSLKKRAELLRTIDNRQVRYILNTVNQLISESGGQDLELMSPEPSRVTSLLTILNNEPDMVSDGPFFRMHRALVNIRDALSTIGLYHVFPNSLRAPQKMADGHPLATGGENLASTLREMIRKESRFLPDLKDALAYAVPGIRDIRVTSAGSYHVVELDHDRDNGNDRKSWFDLSYESDGTIRLLALLTALFQEPSPLMICIEEPELAIHPGAMAVLSDTMEEASLRGQVLVATHSPDLIDRLPPESIRAVTAEGGSTEVARISEHQLKSVHENLFSVGELHSMEGLQPTGSG